MTREQILSLSGPALSDAVAEHVMGWKCIVLADKLSGGTVWQNPASKTPEDKFRNVPRRELLKELPPVPLWEPHNEIRAAFEVVDCMIASGHFIEIASTWTKGPFTSDGPWMVRFTTKKDRHEGITVAWGAILPQVICHAALLYVLTP